MTPRVYPLSELLKGIPKGTKMRDNDWGGAVGNEAW